MSLDVYLYEIAKPDPGMVVCHYCGRGDSPGREIYSRNITHNLNDMAEAAGLYEALWRPDDTGFVYARDLIPEIGRAHV